MIVFSQYKWRASYKPAVSSISPAEYRRKQIKATKKAKMARIIQRYNQKEQRKARNK